MTMLNSYRPGIVPRLNAREYKTPHIIDAEEKEKRKQEEKGREIQFDSIFYEDKEQNTKKNKKKKKGKTNNNNETT